LSDEYKYFGIREIKLNETAKPTQTENKITGKAVSQPNTFLAPGAIIFAVLCAVYFLVLNRKKR
jgi:hypothetical protein